MTAAELNRLAAELGLDVVGAAPASAYEETERAHRGAARARPVRRHALHDGQARDLLPSRAAAAGRALRRRPRRSATTSRRRPPSRARAAAALHVARRLRRAPRAAGRARRRLGGSYRVLVDSNDHVDREAAVRAGVAFYGKNTMAITRRFGSWVVLGTLVTDVEIESTPALELDCGSCRLCIDACPTGRARRPGRARRDEVPLLLDAGARARARGVPRGDRRHGVRLRHLPGRVPLESRYREAATRADRDDEDSTPTVSLRAWLEDDGDELVSDLERLYVPRNEPRWLRRNALIAAGNVGDARARACRRALCGGRRSDASRDAAEWALERMAARSA